MSTEKNAQFIERYRNERALLAKDIEKVNAENAKLEQQIEAMAKQLEKEHFENIEPLTTRVQRRIQVVRNVQQKASEQLKVRLSATKNEQTRQRMLAEFNALYFPTDDLSTLVAVAEHVNSSVSSNSM